METDTLLKNLHNSSTTEERSAILAETILGTLPPNYALIIRKCLILPWFTEEIIRITSLENQVTDSNSVIYTITNLPFVEFVEGSEKKYYTHKATRTGLLTKYLTEDVTMVRQAYSEALPAFLAHPDDESYKLCALISFIVVGQREEADNIFEELMLSLKNSSNTSKRAVLFDAFAEVEQMPFVEPLDFPSKYWTRKVASFLARGNFSKAVEYGKKAIQYSLDDYELYSALGYASALLGHHEEALSYHDQAIQLVTSSKTLAARASTYYLMGEKKKAISDLSRAIKLNPDRSDTQALCYMQRGQIYEDLGSKDLALADFGRAIAVAPYEPEIYILRGTLYSIKNQYPQALDDFNKALTLAPEMESRILSLRAKVHIAGDKLDLALEDANHAIDIDPDNINALYERSQVLYKTGNYEEALQGCLRIIEKEPRHYFAYSLGADILSAQGRKEEAKEFYRNAIEFNSDNSEFCRVLGALTYYDLGYIDIALSAFEKIIQLDPDDVSGLISLGFLHLASSNMSKAEYYIEQSLKIEEAPKALIALGVIRWNTGKISLAKSLFTKAIRKLESSVQTKKGLRKQMGLGSEKAWLYIMLGNKDKGLMMLRNSLKDKDYFGWQNFLVWTKIILESNHDVPDGLYEALEIVQESLSKLERKNSYN